MERLRRKQVRIERGEIASSDESDVEVDSQLNIPAKIWKKLFRFVPVHFSGLHAARNESRVESRVQVSADVRAVAVAAARAAVRRDCRRRDGTR